MHEFPVVFKSYRQVIGRQRKVFNLAKQTLNTSLYLGITNTVVMDWDILKLLKFHLTNDQETTCHLFPAITKKRIHMPFPRQCS